MAVVPPAADPTPGFATPGVGGCSAPAAPSGTPAPALPKVAATISGFAAKNSGDEKPALTWEVTTVRDACGNTAGPVALCPVVIDTVAPEITQNAQMPNVLSIRKDVRYLDLPGVIAWETDLTDAQATLRAPQGHTLQVDLDPANFGGLGFANSDPFQRIRPTPHLA